MEALFFFKAIALGKTAQEEQEKLLFDKNYVNVTQLQEQLLKYLQKHKQVSLKEISTIFPITKGIDEILCYASLKDSRIKVNILDNSKTSDPIKFKSKSGSGITKGPKIIFDLQTPPNN